MRCVIQRVSRAEVRIAGEVVGKIERGLVVLVGIEEEDTVEDGDWLAAKLAKLRIFNDAEGKMNEDLADVKGRLLVVSQFTLHAKTKKGNRPSYIRAAHPDHAIPLYEAFVLACERETQQKVETGRFGAMMEIDLVNDGPVTLWMDTKDKE